MESRNETSPLPTTAVSVAEERPSGSGRLAVTTSEAATWRSPSPGTAGPISTETVPRKRPISYSAAGVSATVSVSSPLVTVAEVGDQDGTE